MGRITMRLIRATRSSTYRLRIPAVTTQQIRRKSSSTKAPLPRAEDITRKEFLLPEPTWSISSLLPRKDSLSDENVKITPAKLRHLLRLSALPEPQTPEDEAQMLADLSEQLHFVRHMQEADVSGIEPLQAIRDETKDAEMDAEITIEKLQYALGQEEMVGKHYKRLRRKHGTPVEDEVTPKEWDPLENAERTVGKYFVVDRSQTKIG